MKKTALITGASGGIGMDLAKIHAAKGDNLVLVARNKNRLEELKTQLVKQYGIDVYTIARDLSVPHSAKQVYDEIKKNKITVNYLINNAGIGFCGPFTEIPFENDEKTIQLNITTLTEFNKLFLKDMLAAGSGKIMNVASTAAFQSGPGMAVYYATKAYVLFLSEAIDSEVRGKGVSVTAYCPGPTETGFFTAGNATESRLVKLRRPASSMSVAESGYKAMMKGKTVAIPGIMNNLMAFSVRLTPRFIVVAITKFLQEKTQ